LLLQSVKKSDADAEAADAPTMDSGSTAGDDAEVETIWEDDEWLRQLGLGV
jgi:hypothetical protein